MLVVTFVHCGGLAVAWALMGSRSNREPNINPAAAVPEIFKKSLLVTSIITPPFLQILMIQTISFIL
jgi:hypothetical protein